MAGIKTLLEDTCKKDRRKFYGIFEELTSGEKPRINPEYVSVLEIVEATKDPLSMTFTEAVQTSQFPTLMGSLLSKKVMKAYEGAKRVSDELVEQFTSDQQTDKIPNIRAKSNIKEVKEGMPYNETGCMDENFAQIDYKKYGEIMLIPEEDVKFDRTGLIMRGIKEYGDLIKDYREELIMKTIQDLTGYEAWYPANSQTALYSTSTTLPHKCSNKITNILSDHTDLDAAKLLLAKMTDDGGNRKIAVHPKVLLVPLALETIAEQLMGNKVMVGVANEQRNPYYNKYKIASSAYLDDNSALYWYLGDFKRQYMWKTTFPLQVVNITGSKSYELAKRDIAAAYKIRFAGQCRAIDHRFVVASDGTV